MPLPALPVFATGPNSPASCKPPPKSAGSVCPAARSHRSSTGPAVQGWSGQEPLPLEHSPERIKLLLKMNKINNKKEANGAVLKLCAPTACSGQADGGRGGPEPSTAVPSTLPRCHPQSWWQPQSRTPGARGTNKQWDEHGTTLQFNPFCPEQVPGQHLLSAPAGGCSQLPVTCQALSSSPPNLGPHGRAAGDRGTLSVTCKSWG